MDAPGKKVKKVRNLTPTKMRTSKASLGRLAKLPRFKPEEEARLTHLEKLLDFDEAKARIYLRGAVQEINSCIEPNGFPPQQRWDAIFEALTEVDSLIRLCSGYLVQIHNTRKGH